MSDTQLADPGLTHLRGLLEPDNTARDSPPAWFLDRMRSAYPTESEFDELLARRWRGRREPRRQQTTLEQLTECLHAFLRAHVQGEYEVAGVRWLNGGASKIQVAFDLTWDDGERGRAVTAMVLRMEPQESLNATSRRREFELLSAMRGVVSLPRVFWVDEYAEWFPEPTLVYEFATGVSKVSGVEGRTTGVGNDFGPALRPVLGEQFVRDLAAIHTADPSSPHLKAFDRPAVGTTDTALWQLNRANRVWDEDRAEDLPVLSVAANWLRRNMPTLDLVSVVHGDYRAGNFLFDERTGQITAWLDWERGHLGDRHRDLAWITLPTFGHYAEDGFTLLVSGLVPLEEFYERYQAMSGLSVDPERLRWYRVLNTYQLVASTLGSAYRVARLGRSHQDVLLTWLEGVVYSLAQQLRHELMEAQR